MKRQIKEGCLRMSRVYVAGAKYQQRIDAIAHGIRFLPILR
ncbi:MAG: hypothetical protein ACYTXC_23360 [Nostoc sp.]